MCIFLSFSLYCSALDAALTRPLAGFGRREKETELMKGKRQEKREH